jgi:hypothetical protein
VVPLLVECDAEHWNTYYTTDSFARFGAVSKARVVCCTVNRTSISCVIFHWTLAHSLFCWMHRPSLFTCSSNRTLRQRSLAFPRNSNGTQCRRNLHLLLLRVGRLPRWMPLHELILHYCRKIKCTCVLRMRLCHISCMPPSLKYQTCEYSYTCTVV